VYLNKCFIEKLEEFSNEIRSTIKPKIVSKQEKIFDKCKITNKKTTFWNFKAKIKEEKLISKRKLKPLINRNEINNVSLEDKIINTKTNENEKITIPLEQIYISESNQSESDIKIYTDSDDNESITLHSEDYKSIQSKSHIKIYTDSDESI
jgi:hypothetical protein